MKQSWTAFCLALLCILAACGESPQTASPDAIDRAPTRKEEYISQLCGYYEGNGIYYSISHEAYEEVYPADQSRFSDTLADINVGLNDDGGVNYYLIFDQSSSVPPAFALTADGTVTLDGFPLQVISREVFEAAVVAVEESGEPPLASDPDTGGDTETYLPWYMSEFDTYELANRLTEIDNLFAVGKKEEAVQVFEKRIIGMLDKKVDELIGRREYFLAQNYVAMLQQALGNNNSNPFPFVEEYLNENTVNSTDKMLSGGIDIIAHRYYSKIRNTALADENVISREECLYVMNRFLIQNGRPTVQGLWLDVHKQYCAYYTEVLVNTEAVEYIFINPYNQNIWVLPREYYFIQEHPYEV